MSLLPERPLLVSPQLAATLGLEEALLYQYLGELMDAGDTAESNGFHWLEMNGQRLLDRLPFWSSRDIRRVSESLRDKGVLLIGSAPFGSDRHFRFAFNEGASRPAQPPRREPATVAGTSLIGSNWQPAADVVAQLRQYGIPEHFVAAQVPEFITYWSERGEPRHSWNAKFLKHVVRLWREEETRSAQRGRQQLMTPDWRPSPDAVEILTRQAGINANFVEDAIPEFILYWQERGERRSTWNSDFVRHVKRQWARYTAALENDTEPRPIPADWQPSRDLFEVLRLANIPSDFARQQVPEFLLFWRDNGQAHSSWNTKFLQHVKRQWARHRARNEGNDHERQQASGGSVSTRHRSLVDDLTDRSWAS